MHRPEQQSSLNLAASQFRIPPPSSNHLSAFDSRSSRLPRQVITNTTRPLRINPSVSKERISSPQPLNKESSRPSSLSSRTTLGRNVHSGQSFNSITQLYYKFKNQPSHPPVRPHRPNSNLSDVVSLSSDYSYQTTLVRHSHRTSVVTQAAQVKSDQVLQHIPSNPAYRIQSLTPPINHSTSERDLIKHRASSSTLASLNSSQLQLSSATLTRCASFQSSPTRDTVRPLNYQSSLPRFTQPKCKLRPRLTHLHSYRSRVQSQVIDKSDLVYPPKLADSIGLSILPVSDFQTSLPLLERTSSIPFTPLFGTYLATRPISPSPSNLSSSLSSSISSTSSSKLPSPNSIPTPVSSSFSTNDFAPSSSIQPIHVIVRVRDQTTPNSTDNQAVTFDNETITLKIPQSAANPNQIISHEFRVDKVIYPVPNSKLNSKLYERCSVESKLLEPFLNGFNASLIAYGQTGSGKSFTLGSDNDPNNVDGLIPKTLSRLFFKLKNEPQRVDQQYEIFISFIEIYNDEIVDLLLNSSSTASEASFSCNSHNNHHLKLQKKVPIKISESKKDGTIDLIGCKKIKVNDLSQVMKFFHLGLNERSTGFTQMNQTSSRSHAIFSVHLVSSNIPSSQNHHLVKKNLSKFQFVDLAGSERINKTKNILGGDRFKEGIFINAGLHSLGNVISALSSQSKSGSKNDKNQKNYIPYRESKLTRLLKDCLGGNSKTILISCISQNPLDLNESLNTLRYSVRAKKIENTTQKITKVVVLPSPRSHSSVSSRIVRKRTSPLKTRTLGSNNKPEIKKPIIKMNDLMSIKALKSIVNVQNPSSSSSLPSDEQDQQQKIIRSYLVDQVQRFVEHTKIPTSTSGNHLSDSRMTLIIKKEILSTLNHHFLINLHNPSSSSHPFKHKSIISTSHHQTKKPSNHNQKDFNQLFDFLVDLHSLLSTFKL